MATSAPPHAGTTGNHTICIYGDWGMVTDSVEDLKLTEWDSALHHDLKFDGPSGVT